MATLPGVIKRCLRTFSVFLLFCSSIFCSSSSFVTCLTLLFGINISSSSFISNKRSSSSDSMSTKSLRKLKKRALFSERTRAHKFPALWRPPLLQKTSLGGISKEYVCRFIFSSFSFLWSGTMIARWSKSYFCSWLSREKRNCLWFRLKSWHCRDLVKNHDSDLSCDWLESFSGMISQRKRIFWSCRCCLLFALSSNSRTRWNESSQNVVVTK